MSDDGRSIEDLAADLKDKRAEVRDLKKANERIPALEGEHKRLKDNAEKQRAAHANTKQELQDAQARISELESELRSKGDLEKQAQQAEADRADALAEKEASDEKYSKAQAKLTEAAHKLDSAEKEIARLKKHEEHTNVFNRLVELTKELV